MGEYALRQVPPGILRLTAYVRSPFADLLALATKHVLGHVLAGAPFGDTQLTGDQCDALLDELSDRSSPDDYLEVIELVGDHIDQRFDRVTGGRIQLVVDLLPLPGSQDRASDRGAGGKEGRLSKAQFLHQPSPLV